MEDGVIESEKIVIRPSKLEVRERDREEEEDREREKRQNLESSGVGVGGGLLDNLMSKLASPTPRPSKPTTTTTHDHHPVDSINHSDDHQDTPIRDSDGGGCGDDDGDGSRGGGGSGSGSGGGVINNIISLFHKSSESSEGEDVVKKNNGNNEEQVEGKSEIMINKLDQESENGSVNNGTSSSFISNLVQEGPGADEASILIHSVVHD